MIEIKPHSVHTKMYRARQHFEELDKVFTLFYTDYKKQVLEANIHRVHELIEFNTTIQVPLRIPLIVGDCLQNMRSSLDYLVWELVKANGGKPSHSHMFPICKQSRNYRKAIESERLLGVVDEAAAIIDALQPYHMPHPHRSRQMLGVLDELTNINKHRHILGTLFENRIPTPGIMPLHYFETMATGPDEVGGLITQRILTYIAFEDTSVKSIEIAGALDALFRYLVEEVFTHFEKFFS